MNYRDAQVLAIEAMASLLRGEIDERLNETALRACASAASSAACTSDQREAATYLGNRVRESVAKAKGEAAYLEKKFAPSSHDATQKGIDAQIAVLRGRK